MDTYRSEVVWVEDRADHPYIFPREYQLVFRYGAQFIGGSYDDQKYGSRIPDFCIQLLIGVAVLFAVGILQEKGIRIRERISSYPLLIRWGIWMILLFSLPFFGYITAGKGGFIYAQF